MIIFENFSIYRILRSDSFNSSIKVESILEEGKFLFYIYLYKKSFFF